MWTHLFTLQALIKELTRLHGASVSEVFTHHKNELLISVQHIQGEEQTIVISIDPRANYIFVRDRVSRPRKNAVNIFPETVGTRIARILLHGSDRVVVIQNDRDVLLCIQLFGTAESNVFLVDEKNTIQKAFKKSKSFEGKLFGLFAKQTEEYAFPDFVRFTSEIRTVGKLTIYAAVKVVVPFLGSTYAREILHRARIDEKAAPHAISDADLQHIFETTQALLTLLQKPTPTVYLRNNVPRVFSLIPLTHLSGAQAETFFSVNEAIRRTVFRSLQTQETESAKHNLIKKLKGEYDRTLHGLAAVEEELALSGRAEQHERVANIILANLLHLTKGTKAVDLENIFSEKRETIRITMDPKLTPSQNAELYFARAKQARAARMETESRVGELRQKETLLGKLLLHLDQCQTEEQVEEFVKENTAALRRWNIFTNEREPERVPFREFTVGNFTVWVGKGSVNNDLLTMRFAKPHDLWFHVRGASGSHVVLRVGGAKTMPHKEAIVKTAQIAAYYSKMRNASAVPVAYCERKFVRKPKGAEPGAVVMDREKVIFVEPGLP
jgi:predicted ribosome quality control (RQC) complex YloA/Tae2 family protein